MNASQARKSRAPEYVAWSNMRVRAKRRGIAVCDRWSKFEHFFADMGARPAGTTLGRIDGSRGFGPGNCRWATEPRTGDMTTSHGHNRDGKRSPTYRAWSNMIQRTTNPKAAGYSYYADRGITVCESWRNSFDAFLADMGERPEGLSLDREDNDSGYWCGHCAECVRFGRPANCRWADWSTQMKNRRRSEASIANLTRAPGRIKAAARRAATG